MLKINTYKKICYFYCSLTDYVFLLIKQQIHNSKLFLISLSLSAINYQLPAHCAHYSSSTGQLYEGSPHEVPGLC